MSARATNPMRSSSSRGLSSASLASSSVASRRWATARSRRPWPARQSASSTAAGSVSGQQGSTTSGAPLTTSKFEPSASLPAAAAYPRLASKGWACTVVHPVSGGAAARTASSVAWAWAPGCSATRGQARAATRRICFVSGVSAGCSAPVPVIRRTTRNRFSVRVPVLSKHMVSTRPSASRLRGVRTRTPSLLSRRAAAICATVATRGMPSGTAATATASPPGGLCAPGGRAAGTGRPPRRRRRG